MDGLDYGIENIKMRMDRRKFLKGMASAGIALTGVISGSELFVPFAEAFNFKKFSFAHITDLHLDVQGESTWEHRGKSIPLFIDALRQIGRLPKLDFIFFGGDQIHFGPNDKDSLFVFQRWTVHLNVPYYILLGDTEVSPNPGVSKLSREDYLNAWRGRGLRPGRSSWAFDPVPGVRFIGFDVTVDGQSYGEASPQSLKWLEKELKENKSKKLIIVATHQLLLPTTPQDLAPGWSLWMVKNHEKVREILEHYKNVRLVISGHHHASRVETAGRITYVADPAIVTYPCAFRHFTVDREGIHLKNIGLDDRADVARALELLIADPYARMYDAAVPQKVAAYSMGLTEQDREATIHI